MKHYTGLDLGGSSVKGAAVSENGEVLAKATQSFEAERPMHFAETVRAVLEDLVREAGRAPDAVGISAPGLADPQGRSIAFMPGRLDGLVGLDWTNYLKQKTPVPVLNDAQAALLGEVWLGAAKGLANVFMLTLGTGVGGAAMVDGRLLRGHTGKAGHLGHVCLDMEGGPDVCRIPGSLEMQIGNCTIQSRTGGRFNSTHELVDACRKDDKDAQAVWYRSVKALALAVSSLTNVLDPEAVIVGGGIARAGEVLFDPLRHMVSETEWKVCGHEVRILPAELGEWAGAIGAAANAKGNR